MTHFASPGVPLDAPVQSAAATVSVAGGRNKYSALGSATRTNLSFNIDLQLMYPQSSRYHNL